MISSNFSRGQNIRIGRIGYSISLQDDISLDEGLGSFVSAGYTDAVFTCQLCLAKRLSGRDVQKQQVRSDIILETDTTWGLYGRSKPILTVPSLKTARIPRLRAEFDGAFKCGIVYVSRAGIHDFLYPFLEALTINLLGKSNGVLVHSCCVDDNGKGYLFVGQSGAGKSTMAGLWDGKPGVRVLSDDRIILSETDDGLAAYGTPWHGSANYAVNGQVLVHRIFFIRHAGGNTVRPVSGMAAVSELIRQAFLPFWDKDGLRYSIDFLGRIGQQAATYDLDFFPDEKVVNFVRGVCR